MKTKVTVHKYNNQLHFYVVVRGLGSYYLFSVAFSKGVYEYFVSGRSESEILSFRKWGRNKRLDRIITRLPNYIRFAVKELILDSQAADKQFLATA